MSFHTHGLDLVIDDTVEQTVGVTKVLVGLPTLTYRVINEHGPGGGWPVVTFTTETAGEMHRFLAWYAPDEPINDLIRDLVYED